MVAYAVIPLERLGLCCVRGLGCVATAMKPSGKHHVPCLTHTHALTGTA